MNPSPYPALIGHLHKPLNIGIGQQHGNKNEKNMAVINGEQIFMYMGIPEGPLAPPSNIDLSKMPVDVSVRFNCNGCGSTDFYMKEYNVVECKYCGGKSISKQKTF